MKFRRRGKGDLNPSDQQKLEGLLGSTIKPMTPSTNFMKSLEDRLLVDAEYSQAQVTRSITSYFLIAAAAGLAISAITIASIRVAIAIIGILGLAHAVNNKPEEDVSRDNFSL